MATGTPALVELGRLGISFEIREYDHDPAAPSFGLEAAEKLGFPADQIFKTLVADVDGDYVVAIVPVNHQVSLKLLAKAVGGKKAAMADPAIAQRITGYVVGGISPIGQKRKLTTVLDENAYLFDTVLVSGGRRGLDIELSPDDLITATSAIVAEIAD